MSSIGAFPADVDMSGWVEWNESLDEFDYKPITPLLQDEQQGIEIYLMSPLGKGVSCTVWAAYIKRLPPVVSIEGSIVALKVFKLLSHATLAADSEERALAFVSRIIKPPNGTPFPQLYTTFVINERKFTLLELCGPSLCILQSMRYNLKFTLGEIRLLLRKLFGALELMETRGLVHGDLKPENILVCFSKKLPIRTMTEYIEHLQEQVDLSNVTICDWSSSSIGFTQEAGYMQSRFYRAPEVIFRGEYGPSVDIWSLGCIAAELFLGEPLFPGEDELEVLQSIKSKLGSFPSSLTKQIGKGSVAAQATGWQQQTKGYTPGTFESLFIESSGKSDFEILKFTNLLRQCLQLSPHARITASEAMRHPFITGSLNSPSQPTVRRRGTLNPRSTPFTLAI